MIDIDQNIPFLWRLSSDNGDGFCMVTMVVPFNQGEERLEHVIASANQVRCRIDQGTVKIKQNSPRRRSEERRGMGRIRLTHDGDSANAARIALITVS